MKRLRTIKILLLAIISLLIIGLINLFSIYTFSQQDETHPADCAIVLGAGVSANHPSPVFIKRLDHAVALYKTGMTTKIILTGGYSHGSVISDAHIARAYIMQKGIPAADIFVEEKSTVTRENLLYAREIMASQHFHTALIVSDPLHMKRSITMAQDLGMTAWSSPTPTSQYKTTYSRAIFLLRESYYYSGYLIYRVFDPA